VPRECTTRYSRGTDDRSLRERDYIYARKRVSLSRTHAGQVYEIPRGLAERLRARRQSRSLSLAASFNEQVRRWKDETAHLSSEAKAISHPSYLRIIGLAKDSSGHELERLLLHELETEPDLWFAALSAVTGEDPVNSEYDFDESVEAWLRWGREKGIV
jgi:hypothetical protein